jgi:heme A synthase
MEAGLACPDAPLCLGQVVPPLVNAPITVHFTHRVLALVVAIFVLAVAVRVLRAETDPVLRGLAGLAAVLVVTQIGLGFASVLTVLGVVPVSLHTLVAASLLATLVALATLASRAAPATPTDAQDPAASAAVVA